VASWSIQLFGHNEHALIMGGGGCAPFRGELGPHPTQCRLSRGLTLHQVASRSIQPFGHDRYGLKMGGVPLLGGGAGSPSNTMWPVPRPTSMPSFVLIHPTILPPFLGGAGSQSNTKSPGPRPTSIPSVILIHPAVWPQQTWAKIGVCAPFGRGSWVPI